MYVQCRHLFSLVYIYVHCTSSSYGHLFSFTAEQPSYRLTDCIISLPIRCVFTYRRYPLCITHLSHLSVGYGSLLMKSVGFEFKFRSNQSLGFHVICFSTVGLSFYVYLQVLFVYFLTIVGVATVFLRVGLSADPLFILVKMFEPSLL